MPMTLISFCETRPPAESGVAMTFMWTTVSTPGLGDDLGDHRVADVGTDELSTADVQRWRDDVDADHPFDARLRSEQTCEASAEITGDASHENDLDHEPPPVRLVTPYRPFGHDPSQSIKKARHRCDGPT